MTVRVRYFAVLRDRAELAEESISCEPQSARALVDDLIERRNLGLASPLIRIAVNGAFVSDETLLSDGDEVVLIPPVAGG